MQTLYRLIYRDRRRLALTGVLLAAAAWIGGDTIPDIMGLPGELVAIGALLVLASVVAVTLPRYRFAVEIGALSNLAFVALGRLLPSSNFNIDHPGVQPLSVLVLYGFTVVGVCAVLTGSWSDRIAPTRSTARARATSHLPPKDLWYGLIPTPGHLDMSPDPEVVSIDYADPARRVIRLLNWLPPATPTELLLHVDAVEPLDFVRLRIERVNAEGRCTIQGETAFRIVDEGLRRRVEIEHSTDALPLRRRLRGWIDDTLGRWTDLRLARVEHAAASATSPRQSEARRPARQQSADLFNAIYADAKRPDGPDRRIAPAPSWLTTSARTKP